MKIAICYKNESGTILYYSKNNGSLTSNIEKASIYTTVEDAQVCLKKINPGSLPKKYKDSISQFKLVDMDKEKNVDYFQEVATQYLNMGMDEFKEQLQGHLEFIAAIP